MKSFFPPVWIVKLLLLFPVVALAALWLDARHHPPKPVLPEGWTVEGAPARWSGGSLLVPEGAELLYENLSRWTQGDYEILIDLRRKKPGRIAFRIGKEGCVGQSIETASAGIGGDALRTRVNIISENDALMVYEDGMPVRRLADRMKGAACLGIGAGGPGFLMEDFRIRGPGGKELYAQTFRQPWPGLSSHLARYFALCALAVLLLLAFEGWIAAGSKRTSTRVAFRSLVIHSAPLALACAGDLSGGGVRGFVPPAVFYLLLSRVAFFFRFGSIFSPTEDDARIRSLLRPFLFTLLFFSIPALFLPALGPEMSGVLIAFLLVGLPLALMCLVSAHRVDLPFYNLIMLLLCGLFLLGGEIGIRHTPYGARWAPSTPAGDMEKHDLLFWIPTGFISEDGAYRGQIYDIPKLDFRSGPASPKKAPGSYRVVVMGASTVWGDGMDDPQKAFPQVMESILNRRENAPPVEVINGGVNGYSSLQVLVLLKTYLVRYEPDLIFFYMLWNDIAQSWGAFTLREAYEMASNKRLHALFRVRKRLEDFRLYNLYGALIHRLREGVGAGAGGFAGEPGRRRRLKPTKGLDDFRKNLDDIATVCRRHGIQAVFVTEYQSADHAAGHPYRQTDLERIMEEEARAHNIPFLDANLHFYQTGDWRELALPGDEVHLSENGHVQVAGYLVDFLVESIFPTR